MGLLFQREYPETKVSPNWVLIDFQYGKVGTNFTLNQFLVSTTTLTLVVVVSLLDWLIIATTTTHNKNLSEVRPEMDEPRFDAGSQGLS